MIKEKTYKDKGQTSLRQQFEQYARQNKDVEAVFTGSADGVYVQHPYTKMPDGYNPAERPWFQEAVEKKAKSSSLIHTPLPLPATRSLPSPSRMKTGQASRRSA